MAVLEFQKCLFCCTLEILARRRILGRQPECLKAEDDSENKSNLGSRSPAHTALSLCKGSRCIGVSFGAAKSISASPNGNSELSSGEAKELRDEECVEKIHLQGPAHGQNEENGVCTV